MPDTAAAILARVLGPQRVAELNLQPGPRTPEPRMTRAEQTDWNRRRAVRWHEHNTDPEFVHLRPDQPQVEAWARRYITNPHTAGSLLLLGSHGTGKTGNCYGALRLIAESGIPPIRRIAILESRLYAVLRPGSIEHEMATPALKNINTYGDADVLFIDDIGRAKASEWTTAEGMFPLVDHRCRKHLPTLLTSNLDLAQLADLYGQATISRLRSMVTVVAMTGPDRRKAAS